MGRVLFVFIVTSIFSLTAWSSGSCDISKCKKECSSGNSLDSGAMSIGGLGGTANDADQLRQKTNELSNKVNQASANCETVKASTQKECEQNATNYDQQAAATQDPGMKMQYQNQAKQEREKSKQCGAAAGAFEAGNAADLAQLAQALAQALQAMQQSSEDPDNIGQEKEAPTECQRLRNRYINEKNNKKKVAIKNLMNKKCDNETDKEAGKDPTLTANAVRSETRPEEAKRAQAELSRVGNGERVEKEAYLRQMLNCEEPNSLQECCSQPGNARFCNSNVANADGVESSGALEAVGGGGASALGFSNDYGEKEKVEDREIAGTEENKDGMPKLDLSPAEGGGGGSGSLGGGYKPYNDDEDEENIPKPTVNNVKLAAQASKMTGNEIAPPQHDMFHAVTLRMRRAYMKGQLIQTRGVLFKRR